MKHTPGPWEACGSTVYAGEVMVATAECEAWRDIAGYDDAPAMPDSPGELNEFGHSAHGAGVEESWANARLIAAAPELYAALSELYRAANQFSDSLDCWLCGSLAGEPHGPGCAVSVAANALRKLDGAA